MPTANSPTKALWISTDEALEAYLDYYARFGELHVRLACHLAFPMILTPELVNLIRINFLESDEVPWIAESDFLLSKFCYPLGDGLYQVDLEVRKLLLEEFTELHSNSKAQIKEMAYFLLTYHNVSSKLKRKDRIQQAHVWIAQSTLRPQFVLEKMQRMLADGTIASIQQTSITNNMTTQLYVTSMLELVKSSLYTGLSREEHFNLEALLKRAEVILSYWYTNHDSASQLKSRVIPVQLESDQYRKPHDPASQPKRRAASIQLKPDQYKKLHDALVNYFSASDLRYILRVYFDLSRGAIAAPGLSNHNLVTELIDYCEDHSLLERLIQSAVEERPHVGVFQELQYELAPLPVIKHDPALLEARFNKMVEDLGSDNLAVQISAAVMLLIFLKPEYESYHDRVYYILRAHLREDHHAEVRELLVDAFERAIRLGLPYTETKSSLDMSRTNLPRIDLGGLDLSGADIAFANLQSSNLEETKLFRARGYGVDLDDDQFGSDSTTGRSAGA